MTALVLGMIFYALYEPLFRFFESFESVAGDIKRIADALENNEDKNQL